MPTLDANHQYSENGVHVPGVTSILGEWIKAEWYGQTFYVHARTGFTLSESRIKELASIGTAIHRGMLFMLTGQGLNWDRLNPVLVAPLRQGEKWIQENKPTVIIAEKPLYSKRYGYAGTLDLFCATNKTKKGHRMLIDIKSGMFDSAGPQTAAYEVLAREETGFKGIIDRFVLRLPKDGSEGGMVALTDKTDLQYFLHKLTIWNEDQRRAA